MTKEVIPYQPKKLPLNSLSDGQMIGPLGEARARLADYNALLLSLPNPNIIVFTLLDEEATTSSQIEGTQASLDELLKDKAGVKEEAKRDDIQEIKNYRSAMEKGQAALEGRGQNHPCLCPRTAQNIDESSARQRQSPRRISQNAGLGRRRGHQCRPFCAAQSRTSANPHE